ncbi:MAG: ABC transporter permease [Verrucomicrobiales bacterium]|nr:ABC transporter permease [Verrucomicrobiales bacterium]
MLLYLVKRLGGMVIVLFCAVTAVFFMFQLVKGGPFDSERSLSEEAKLEKLRQFNMHRHPVQNYLAYMSDLLHGDMRVSLKAQNFKVTEIIGASLPISAKLGGAAFLLAAGGGILSGAYAASRKQRAGDRIVQGGAMLFISTPTFVTGPLLALVFAIGLAWLPVGGWFSWKHAILPTVCLALYYGANVSRLMRNSMVEVLNRDFIRTARAKGLSESRVIYKHALKVALVPVISYLGPMAAYLLTGSMIVESVFAIPGMGQHFVNATLNRDPFLLIGAVIVYCLLVVICNLLADLLLCLVDPRVKLHA